MEGSITLKQQFGGGGMGCNPRDNFDILGLVHSGPKT